MSGGYPGEIPGSRNNRRSRCLADGGDVLTTGVVNGDTPFRHALPAKSSTTGRNYRPANAHYLLLQQQQQQQQQT